jgi:hypothetical protein
MYQRLFILSAAVLLALPVWAADSPDAKEVTLLFVQSAEGARYREGRLTLDNVSPSTIFFSDRPERVAGHVTTADFLHSWNEGKDSFEKDPPNAVLSVLTKGEVKNVVVTLRNPRLEGDDLLFDVKVLQGEVPAESGVATLFIDGLIARALPGAGRGAALGAVGGAIGGNAGKGAAIGAAVGGLGSIMRQNRQAREAYYGPGG